MFAVQNYILGYDFVCICGTHNCLGLWCTSIALYSHWSVCNCLKLFGWYDWSGKPCCKMQSQWSIKDRTVTLHISSTLINVAYYVVVKIHVIFRSAKNLKYVVQHMCIWAYVKLMPSGIILFIPGDMLEMRPTSRPLWKLFRDIRKPNG